MLCSYERGFFGDKFQATLKSTKHKSLNFSLLILGGARPKKYPHKRALTVTYQNLQSYRK